jgi:hypothetical protein
MPIDVALLGCAHPHLPDVLGVLASESDLRLVAAWDADPAGAIDGWFDGPTAWMRDPQRAGVGRFGELALHLVDAPAALPSGEPPALAAVVLDP